MSSNLILAKSGNGNLVATCNKNGALHCETIKLISNDGNDTGTDGQITEDSTGSSFPGTGITAGMSTEYINMRDYHNVHIIAQVDSSSVPSLYVEVCLDDASTPAIWYPLSTTYSAMTINTSFYYIDIKLTDVVGSFIRLANFDTVNPIGLTSNGIRYIRSN